MKKNKEKGFISVIILAIFIGVILLWQIWKPAFLTPVSGLGNRSAHACRAEVNTPITISYTKNTSATPTPVSALYRLISRDRKIDPYFIFDYNGPIRPGRGEQRDSTTHLKYVSDTTINGQTLPVYEYCYETLAAGGGSRCGPDGTHTNVPVEGGGTISINLANDTDRGLLYIRTDGSDISKNDYWNFDVYLRNDVPIPLVGQKCIDTIHDSNSTLAPTIRIPSPSVTTSEDQLQLKYFTVEYPRVILDNDWLSPHCKPILYLYPQQKQQVSVKLNPKGYLTASIPTYPKEGWLVTAYPDGTIFYKDKTYEYLYYESKIFDTDTKIPEKGYVRKYEELKKLYEEILPELGLNDNEAKEFIDYWVKVLPKSPYYFVGVMDKSSIDYIEPLTITPNPDKIIRVRIYFKALDNPINVKEPIFEKNITRDGFTVVEWGGMVKRDAKHPFTCSE